MVATTRQGWRWEKEREERDRKPGTEEERPARKREERDRPAETEEERAARKAKEREDRERGRKPETEEERAARKAKEQEERERGRREGETEESRATRKAKEREARDRKPETEEERAARKAKEREREALDRDRRPETEEERAARKAKEREKGRLPQPEGNKAARGAETKLSIPERPRGELSQERKEREKPVPVAGEVRDRGKEDRQPETEEERAARKAKEREERARRERGDRKPETEEERATRKAKEREGEARGDRKPETEEERAARKAKEREAEGRDRKPETEEERAVRKAKEREREARDRDRKPETEEERAARKAKEREARVGTEAEAAVAPRRTPDPIRANPDAHERVPPPEATPDRTRNRTGETEEERAARKAKEHSEQRSETEGERTARKERERAGHDKERGTRKPETEEERAARKAKEREDRDRGGSDPRASAKVGERDGPNRERPPEVASSPRPPGPPVARGPESSSRVQHAEGKTTTLDEHPVARKGDERRERSLADIPASRDDYGEDFEDYDDEFDDFDEEKEEQADRSPVVSSGSDTGGTGGDPRVLEMRRAVEKENRDLRRRTERQRRSSNSASTPAEAARPARWGRRRMDPTESRRLEKLRRVYVQRLERARQLQRLVDLDVVTIDIADIVPPAESGLTVAQSGANSAGTQMPDPSEIAEIEVQTDKIHFRSRDAQVPEDLGLRPQPTGLIAQEKDKEKGKDAPLPFVRIDTVGLGRFLSRAYPVLRVLLSEGEKATTAGTQKTSHEFSSSFVRLDAGAAAAVAGRAATALAFSDVSPQSLLVAYGPAATGANEGTYSGPEGTAVVWNVNSPQSPQLLLAAGGPLACVCWSAQRASLCFAGGRNGAVYLWDHREPDHLHRDPTATAPQTAGKRHGAPPVLRMPTYSTECMWRENHQAPIVRILPVGYNSPSPAEGSEQVATLDIAGTIMFWVVVDCPPRGAADAPEADPGLAPFGAVKLVKSSQLTVANPQRPLGPGTVVAADKGLEGRPGSKGRREEVLVLPAIATFDLEFQPDDPSQMFVGTDTGFVVHCPRYTHAAAAPPTYFSVGPNEFLNGEARARILAGSRDPKYGTRVLSVHFCPTDPQGLLAAGYADGSISIFAVDDRVPKVHIPSFTAHPIVWLRWSPRSRGFFLALDSAGTLFSFDLLRDQPGASSAPFSHSDLTSRTIVAGKERTARPVALEFCPDLLTDSKVAIAYNDGHVELHHIRKDFVKQSEPETFFMTVV